MSNCDNCGAERTIGAPCSACKYQPESEWTMDNIPDGGTPELVAPEVVTEPDVPVREPTLEEIDEFEICPTPSELALAICRRLEDTYGVGSSGPQRILEPSGGSGAFVAAARATWPNAYIIAIEIRPECRDALFAAGANEVIISSLEDWFKKEYQSVETATAADLVHDADLVLGNPPFSRAEKHIRLLLGAMKSGAVLAFLLKMAFYESFERIPFWKELPEDSFAPLVPRPNFKLNRKGKKGTDSQAYGLFDWTAGKAQMNVVEAASLQPRRAPHIVWREEQKKRPRGRPRKVKPLEVAPMADAERNEQPSAGDTGPIDLE